MIDVSVHLERVCDFYRQHRRELLPYWFRETHQRVLGNSMGRSANTLTGLAKSLVDLVPKVFDKHHQAVAVFAIGSFGRLEATPESDIDLVVVLEDHPGLDFSEGQEKTRELYRHLVCTRTDLRFEHADAIRNGTFDLSRSLQYPVLSLRPLVEDPRSAGRRMQLLCEAKALYNHELAESIWRKLITTYTQGPGHKGTNLLQQEFSSFFQGFWRNFIIATPEHVTNSQIIKLVIHRELALFASSLILAYVYQSGKMRDDNWQGVLHETVAPITNKLLRWCETPVGLPNESLSTEAREELERRIEECIGKLSKENQNVYKEWFKSQELKPLPFFTVSLCLIVLAEILLADYDRFVYQASQPGFREWIDKERTDIVTWQTNRDFIDIWNTRESIVKTMEAFSSLALALMDWRERYKMAVSRDANNYLKLAKDQRIFTSELKPGRP